MESHIDYQKMGDNIKQLLTSNGMKEPMEDRRKVYQVIRGGAATLLEYGLPEEALETTLRDMDAIMNNIELDALPTMQLKPYAEETLQALTDDGRRLGISTRSHGGYARKTLEKFNITHYFHGVLGRDEVPYPKPDPRHLLDTLRLIEAEPHQTLYVGDTTTDLTTAEAANVRFIGYWRDEAWAKRLMDGGCREIVKDLRKIVELARG